MGLLIGGLFGFTQLVELRNELSQLPVASQFRYIGVTWYSYALMGGVSVALALVSFRVWAGLSNQEYPRWIWPPAASIAASLGFGVINIQTAEVLFLVFIFCIAFFYFFCWLTCHWKILANGEFWALANMLAVLAALGRTLSTTGSSHGANGSDTVFLVPLIVMSGFGLWMLSGHRNNPRIRILSVCLPLLALCMSLLAQQPSKNDPIEPNVNVVLITIDTLRADHLESYGNDEIQTPNLDALAKSGTVFENSIVPMPLTNPSHTSLLTGLYPGNHGVVNNRPISMDAQHHTLAEVLLDRGYKTAGFISGFPLRKQVSRLAEHFEVFEDNLSNSTEVPGPVLENSLTINAKFIFQGRMGLWRLGFGIERQAEKTVVLLKKWLNLNAQSTFFLWVHLFDPHENYSPPAPFDQMYDTEYSGPADGNWEALSIEQREKILANDDDLEHMKALYAGEVSYVDLQVGKILAELDRLGLSEQTLVVFTSDHGECFTEYNVYFGHSECLAEASIKVPLIIRFPENRYAGIRITKMVETVDIYPTILDYLAFDLPNEIDGTSFLNGLQNGSKIANEKFAVTTIYEFGSGSGRRGISIRSSRYKYVWYSAFWAHLVYIPETEAFYDLANDPDENKNLVTDQSQLEFIESFRQRMGDYRDKWLQLRSSSETEMSLHDMKALRALGYIQ